MDFLETIYFQKCYLCIERSRPSVQKPGASYKNIPALLPQILETDWNNAAALIGRGSAYALQSNRNEDGLSPIAHLEQSKQKLKDAVADFTAAIQFEPRLAEAWKRRGQARTALGEVKEVRAWLSIIRSSIWSLLHIVSIICPMFC